MIYPLESIVIFSIGWAARGKLSSRICFRCSVRKLVLAGAKWLLRKPGDWRIKGAFIAIMFGSVIDVIKVLGWSNSKSQFKEAWNLYAGTAKKAPMSKVQ